MRVDVTKGRPIEAADLRTSAEVAPSLALPWIVRLRYGVLGGQTALILLTRFALGVELPLGWLAVPLALSAASNRLVYTLARRIGDRRALGYLLAFDTLLLTLLLSLTGGPANPLTLLYLVQICLSAVVLSKSWTWALGAASTLGFGLLFVWHVTVPVLEAHHHGGGFSIHLGGMWVSFAAATLLISISIGRVSDALRLREQEVLFLQDRIARQEKLASLVTLAAGAAHELGSPLATIAVVAKMLAGRAARVQGRGQKDVGPALTQQIGSSQPVPGFEPAVCDLRKAECVAIVERRLLGVADIELNVMDSLQL